MADEQKPKKPKKVKEPEAEDGVLVAAAKTVGKAAGKVAALVAPEPVPAPMHPKSVKPQKLQKKNKSRLPRREKKALQKSANKAK